MSHSIFVSTSPEDRASSRLFHRLDKYKHRPGKIDSSGPNCTVLTISLAKPGERALDGSEIGSLHNKHGYARGEHCHRGDRYHDPSQA